jgi:uncharacterized protein (TIGR04255 family)
MWYAIVVGWTLTKHSVETFNRNLLATVIVQLRFRPILKLAEQHADFQEAIRPRFSGYELVDTQTFEFGPAGAVNVRNEKAHRFPAPDEPAVVSLNSSAVAIEYSSHEKRETLIDDVRLLLAALAKYGPVPARLGLRYVNIIEPKKLSAILGRVPTWSELLTSDFAAVPGGLASVDESTNYLAEVTSPFERGKMTVRYGLLRPPGDTEQHFRLDTDRFLEGDFVIKEVPNLLEMFSDDIFQVFKKVAGPALLRWMSAEVAK